MGCPHPIKVRAGPHVPPAQRRPGISPPASVPSRLKIIVILTLCRHLILSPPFHPGATPSAPSTHHSRARLLWWTGSRCDSVCLRSRHFVAWHRPGLAHAFPPGATLPPPGLCPEQNPKKTRNNTFYAMKPHPTITQRIVADPRGGRARHSVRAAIGIPPPEHSAAVAIQTLET